MLDSKVFHQPGVCLTPQVPFSGFDYPLNGFFLSNPLNPISDSSVHGAFSFRVLPSTKILAPFGVRSSHAVLTTTEPYSLCRAALARSIVKSTQEPSLSWSSTSLKLSPRCPCQNLTIPTSLLHFIHLPMFDCLHNLTERPVTVL